MCVLIVSRTLSEAFLIRRRNGRDVIIKVLLVFICNTGIFVRFLWNLYFLDKISKNKIANDDQQDAIILVFYLFLISSTCFERPSSGALDCIYSFW